MLTRSMFRPYVVMDGEGGGATPPATDPPAADPPAPAATEPPATEPDAGRDATAARLRREADEQKRRADALQKQLDDKARKDAEEQGRWKELAEQEKAQREALEQRVTLAEQERQIETVARGLKFRDPDLVKHLLPASVDRNDSAAIRQALEQIAQERKHLVEGAAPPPSGGPAGGSNNDAPALTREQVAAMTPQQIAALDAKDLQKALAS